MKQDNIFSLTKFHVDISIFKNVYQYIDIAQINVSPSLSYIDIYV